MSKFYVNTNRIETPNQDITDAYAQPSDYLRIEIKDPITHITNGKKFTDYCVSTKTNMSIFKFKETNVRRRFRDFEWLKKELEKTVDVFLIQLSGFPSKAISRQLPFRTDMGIFDSEFIENRRSDLQNFMNKIGTHPLVKKQVVFHMFLQSLVINKNYIPGDTTRVNIFFYKIII
ncbi:hypothetical protein HZS_6652 [Henneguya salminicola]|nr:hypothetical protein HZS_6652 [Henneguya salminicola]